MPSRDLERLTDSELERLHSYWLLRSKSTRRARRLAAIETEQCRRLCRGRGVQLPLAGFRLFGRGG